MIRRLLSRSHASDRARDTDRDWQIIGETEPYFGVLTAERFKRDNLDAATRDEFFSYGASDIDGFIRRMQEVFGPFAPRSALDFGCGVGRLTLPLAELTGSATGVDISPGMLAEARKHSHPGVRFTDSIPEEAFDWVVSAIVLQHIPPDRGYAILDTLLSRVAPGGGATIQLIFGRTEGHEHSAGARLVIGPQGVRPARRPVKHRKIPEGVMIMHDYDMSYVIGTFYRHGLTKLFLEHCDHGGMVGATIYARKEASF